MFGRFNIKGTVEQICDLVACLTCAAVLALPFGGALAQTDPVTNQLEKTLESASVEDAVALAQQAIDEGRFEQAVGILSGLLLGDPDNAQLKLLMGDLYSRMGSFAQAQIYVQDALKSGQLNADQTQEAEILLALTTGGQPQARDPFRYSANVSTGLRYRSNATGGTTSDSILINDQVVNAGNNAQADEDTDWFLNGSFRTSYELDPATNLTMDGFLLIRRQFRFTNNDIIVGEVTPGASFRVLQNQQYVVDIKPYGILGFTDLDDHYAQSSVGFGATFREIVSQTMLLNQGFEYRSVDYNAIPGRESLTELDGHEMRFIAGVTKLLGENWVLGADYLGTDRDTVTLTQDRQQHRLRGTASYRYATPFGLSDEASRVRGSIAYTKTNFENADPVVSANTVRRDNEWRFDVTNSLALREDLTMDFSLSHSERRSNLDNFETDNTSAALGLTLAF